METKITKSVTLFTTVAGLGLMCVVGFNTTGTRLIMNGMEDIQMMFDALSTFMFILLGGVCVKCLVAGIKKG